MRRSRSHLLARGSAAAGIATFAALVSHVSAGGAMPTWLGLAVPTLFSVVVCTLLAGRKLSLTRLSIAVLLSQGLFHALFVLGASDVMMVSTPGHNHAAMIAQGSLAMSASDTAALYGDTTMWFGHALAASVTIVAIARGERTVRALLREAGELRTWVGRRIRLLVALLPALPVPPQLPAVRAIPAPRLPLVLRHIARRGPPPLITV